MFNIQQADSLDQNIVDLMYERIDSVVADLAGVQKHEFNDGLKDEILGQLAELIDVESILKRPRSSVLIAHVSGLMKP
ncbi:hypothetical protein HG619_15920 [Pseudomonas syringae]|nr:hypothetical protein [Pseudomonas syringae]